MMLAVKMAVTLVICMTSWNLIDAYFAPLQLSEVCDGDFDKCSQSSEMFEMTLVEKLLRRYEKNNHAHASRPVYESTDVVRVKYGMSLNHITEINAGNNMANMVVRETMMWKDILLSWDPASYGDIISVVLPLNRLWKPDITLYNSVSGQPGSMFGNDALVSSDGTVMYMSGYVKRIMCSSILEKDTTKKPNVTCNFTVGSWTRNALEVDIDFFGNLADMDVTNYSADHRFELLDTKAVREEKTYPCCAKKYPSLTFTLVFRQKT